MRSIQTMSQTPQAMNCASIWAQNSYKMWYHDLRVCELNSDDQKSALHLKLRKTLPSSVGSSSATHTMYWNQFKSTASSLRGLQASCAMLRLPWSSARVFWPKRPRQCFSTAVKEPRFSRSNTPATPLSNWTVPPHVVVPPHIPRPSYAAHPKGQPRPLRREEYAQRKSPAAGQILVFRVVFVATAGKAETYIISESWDMLQRIEGIDFRICFEHPGFDLMAPGNARENAEGLRPGGRSAGFGLRSCQGRCNHRWGVVLPNTDKVVSESAVQHLLPLLLCSWFLLVDLCWFDIFSSFSGRHLVHAGRWTVEPANLSLVVGPIRWASTTMASREGCVLHPTK